MTKKSLNNKKIKTIIKILHKIKIRVRIKIIREIKVINYFIFEIAIF